MNKRIIIAEIGCSHLGLLERAKELSALAKDSGANILKTQKRNPEESIKEDLKNKPHPNPQFAYGNTYLEHRKALELSIQDHYDLKSYCESIDIEYMSSVFDISSAKEIISISPKSIKIPSCCNTHFELIDYVLDNFNGKIHLSLGMTTPQEKQNILKITRYNPDRFILYHCTGEYPCPYNHLYLKEIENLKLYNGICGFSNHNNDINTDIRAYVLGRHYIERHFIDSKEIRHTDTQTSITPSEMANLRINLDNMHVALNYKTNITKEEIIQRDKLKYY